MQDLFRFVWRGALGGMIVPILSVTYYYLILFGPAFLLYILLISVWLAIPGAIVGAILWFLCARYVAGLGAPLRITLGTAIASTVMLLMSIFTHPSGGDVAELFQSILNFPRVVFLILLNGASIGGLAGWLCPATTVFREEPKLTYWERVREYEAAQAERDYWKAQLKSKSGAEKRSA